jgi:hypothetical protein
MGTVGNVMSHLGWAENVDPPTPLVLKELGQSGASKHNFNNPIWEFLASHQLP